MIDQETQTVNPTTPSDETPGDIEMAASVDVMRPVADVFEFWRALENFPKFMHHVKEVRETSTNRYFWRVSGPVGAETTWEAEVTQVVPKSVIAWQSVEGSTVDNSGVVRFESTPAGGTHIAVELKYTPPAGQLGHAVATLFGANPAQQMEEDLQRCKTLLESGQITDKDGTTVTEGDVRH